MYKRDKTLYPLCTTHQNQVNTCTTLVGRVPKTYIVQGQLCTICKNRAPHVNFCHPVVLKSYGSKVSKKIGWHFFKPGSRSFQGHIISNV